ncbi:MAG TPA: hypothetical protein VJ836_03495 [Candidatus Saccharimonadales bacterium]|nr:hypothetical protein [Candidatus Saccharimonadales bacterium]
MAEIFFELTDDEKFNGIAPVIDYVFSQNGYEGINAASFWEVEVNNERSSAILIPAVRLILDGTLGILSQPSVRERLPHEVADRALIAGYIANLITKAGVEGKLFQKLYFNDPHLRPWIAGEEGLRKTLGNVGHLGSQGASPFMETKLAAGSALRVLQQGQGDARQLRDVLKRSRGLHIIGEVRAGNSKEINAYLGSPYAHEHHYKLGADDKGNTNIAFTRAARRYLGRYMAASHGYPARWIEAIDDLHATVFTQGWDQIVDYLVTDQFTVDATDA